MPKLWSAASLRPDQYWSPGYFALEQKTIFTNHWIFTGLKQEISAHNDYISANIAGRPVIVRNMKNRLVAFHNVCSHRHALIHPEGCGKAAFRCSYHGWTYNADGVPIGVPDNAASFGLNKETKHDFALEPVAVDSCGDFVFVRLAPKGPSLHEWLGPLAASLEHLSEFQPRIYGKIKQEWACNWKSGVEITLEGYHAPFVHPATFGRHLGMAEATDDFGDASVTGAQISMQPAYGDAGFTRYEDPHSLSRGSLSKDSEHHLDAIASRLRMKRSLQFSGFDHMAIYPNFMIGTNHGVNTCIQLYMPVSASRMQALCWLTTGAPDPKLDGGVIWETVTKNWRQWTQTTWLEDQHACERIQTGIRHARRRAIIGKAEARIAHIQNMWLADTVELSAPPSEEEIVPLPLAS